MPRFPKRLIVIIALAILLNIYWNNRPGPNLRPLIESEELPIVEIEPVRKLTGVKPEKFNTYPVKKSQDYIYTNRHRVVAIPYQQSVVIQQPIVSAFATNPCETQLAMPPSYYQAVLNSRYPPIIKPVTTNQRRVIVGTRGISAFSTSRNRVISTGR